MKKQSLTYLPFLFFLLLTATLQSCSKSKIAPSDIGNTDSDTTGTSVAINSSTGFNLPELKEEDIFQVISNSNKYLDLVNHSDTPNNSPLLAALSNISYQKWNIKHVGNGYFTIANQGSKKFLEASDKDNSQLQQGDFNNSDTQLWQVMALKDKYYKIINKASGLALTDSEDGKLKLTPFLSSNLQFWGFNKITKANDFSVVNLIQDNMVIQSGKPFKLWGKATINSTVSIKASWDSKLYSANTDVSGNWAISLPPAEVNNTAQTLTFSVDGTQSAMFNNLLIGEVWLCAGQSNMAMPMTKISDAFGGFHGVFNYEAEIAAANYPNIRMLTIPPSSSATPKENLNQAGNWSICNPTNAKNSNFSAVAYYFARKLQNTLPGNVPIGVVVTAVSATAIEQWSSAETIAKDPITKNYYTATHASNLYNAMINPLKNLSIKGILWYQGESNYSNSPASNYSLLHRNMIKDWRTLFNQGTLPFYFVQLPPFGTLFADASLFSNSLFREAQANVRTVEKTGMACVMDTNEPYNIHNIYKQPVGERLALLALENDYNLPIKSVGPQFISYIQNGNTVSISFKNADGLTTNGKTSPPHFYVASATDKKFIAANNISVVGNTIQFDVPISGMSVDAIRYAFTDISVTYINNEAGLPMEPFRTDNW